MAEQVSWHDHVTAALVSLFIGALSGLVAVMLGSSAAAAFVLAIFISLGGLAIVRGLALRQEERDRPLEPASPLPDDEQLDRAVAGGRSLLFLLSGSPISHIEDLPVRMNYRSWYRDTYAMLESVNPDLAASWGTPESAPPYGQGLHVTDHLRDRIDRLRRMRGDL